MGFGFLESVNKVEIYYVYFEPFCGYINFDSTSGIQFKNPVHPVILSKRFLNPACPGWGLEDWGQVFFFFEKIDFPCVTSYNSKSGKGRTISAGLLVLESSR